MDIRGRGEGIPHREIEHCVVSQTGCKVPVAIGFEGLDGQNHHLIWHWQFCPGWEVGLQWSPWVCSNQNFYEVNHFLLCGLRVEVECSLFLSRAHKFFVLAISFFDSNWNIYLSNIYLPSFYLNKSICFCSSFSMLCTDFQQGSFVQTFILFLLNILK